jgi:hypothetical protein
MEWIGYTLTPDKSETYWVEDDNAKLSDYPAHIMHYTLIRFSLPPVIVSFHHHVPKRLVFRIV